MKLAPQKDHSPSRDPINAAYNAGEQGSDVRMGDGNPRTFYHPGSTYETRSAFGTSRVADGGPAYALPYTPPLRARPLGSRAPEAPHGLDGVPFLSGTPVEGATPANVDTSALLGGLDEATLASLTCEKSSNFSLTPGESAKKPTLNSPQNDADNEQPAPRSLLADFAAGDIRATVPLGPASNTGDDPFAVSPTPNAPAAKGPTTPEASGPQKLVTSAKGGRRSKTTLEQCDAAFKLIDETLDDLATTVNKSTSTVKKWYLESSKDLRTGVNVWNLFQAYWARHKEEELT
ncbi:hypothetical protein H0H92_009198, partial [Tricholoma furcatifolium]